MKALTLGGAMIDTIAIIASDKIERMSMMNADNSFLLLEEGRKTEALEISTHVGGGAVNAAIAMARLGLDVAALVKLGKDARAETVLARLLAEGVSTRWAMRDGRAPTGASVLVSSHDRNAAIFTFRGANTLLEEADLRKEAFATDLVYVSSLSNASADAFPAVVAGAKAQGALVAANPGVRQLTSRTQAFHDTLAHIDILAINRGEADALVPGLVGRFGELGAKLPAEAGEQLPRLAVRGFSGGGHDMSLAGFFLAMRRLGPRYVVVTDGRHGAFLGTHEAILHCPVLETRVAGTAGAGDAFNATFTACVALGRPAQEALQAAAVNAASVVSHIDTQTGLLGLAEIDKRIAAKSAELKVRIWSQPGVVAKRSARSFAMTRGMQDIATGVRQRVGPAMDEGRPRVGQRAQAVLARAGSCALFIDIDGTLLGVAPTPNSVYVPSGLVPLLDGVRRGLGGAMAVLTGRRIADVDRLFAPLRFVASGVHGTELRAEPGAPIATLAPEIPSSIVAGDVRHPRDGARCPRRAQGLRRGRALPKRPARTAGTGVRRRGHPRLVQLRPGAAQGAQGSRGGAARLFQGHGACRAGRGRVPSRAAAPS